MSCPANADYLVRGYACRVRHHPFINFGELLLETWHIGEASMQAEVQVWQARAARGEVSKIEVVDLKDHSISTRPF